jgi:hypothetical protein
MSKTIREYRSIVDDFPNSSSMIVTSTSQGKYGCGVQLTLDNDYIVLAENQVKDLILILRDRINCKNGFRSSDLGEHDVIIPKKIRELQ